MRFLNLWWVPFGCAALFVIFSYNALISWNVGLVWGGDSVLLDHNALPFGFIGFDITSGQFLAALFIVFAFFQFLMFGIISDTVNDKEYVFAGGLFFIALGLIAISVFTGMAYHSGQTDLTFRKSAAIQTRWSNTNVTLNNLYNKTQDIAPRRAEIIRADIAIILNKRVVIKRRTRTVDKLTRKCTRSHRKTHKLCDQYFILQRELAASISFTKNNSDIAEVEDRQALLMTIDPAAYFTLFKNITGVDADKQKTGRLLGVILLNELLTLLGIAILKRGARRSPNSNRKPNKFNPQPPKETCKMVPESVNESVAESCQPGATLSVIQGGASMSPKEQSLMEYIRFTGPTNWRGTDEFMNDYRGWCAARELPAFGRNFVGHHLSKYAGERREIYIQKLGQNRSKRIEWKLNNWVSESIRMAA